MTSRSLNEMAKWIVEGALAGAPGGENPEFVSEPFLTEEAAKSFARLLRKKSYVVSVKFFEGGDESETMTEAKALDWMNSVVD
jgi:hypothetical protein